MSVGYKEHNITFVPISGLQGLNLVDRTSQPKELQQWYNDSWYSKYRDEKQSSQKNDIQLQPICLIEALEKFKTPKKPINKPTRVCIYAYYNKPRAGTSQVFGDCLSVKVESGVLSPESKMLLMPLQAEVTVKGIEIAGSSQLYVSAGQLCDISIAFNRKDFDPEFIAAGHVLCDPEWPVHQVCKIRAKIIVYETELPILKGTRCVVYSFSSKVPGRISSLETLIDSKTDEVTRKKPKKLVKGNYAQVVIKMEARVCLELFQNNKAMGRIALRDGNDTIAAGQVIELVS